MFEERYGRAIDQIAVLIVCEDGGVQVFEGRPIDYTEKLFNEIRDYQESKGLFG